MSTKKVLITGPESTGKTVLCEYLSNHFDGHWVPEYARSYIENLGRPYVQQDVIEIGKIQLDQWNQDYNTREWVFFDTGLIITKVWLELVYDDSPAWIEEALSATKPELTLLCYPDLDWEADPVRENGGAMRNQLFNNYEENLKHFAYPYEIVRGRSKERYKNALIAINKYFKR